MSKSKKVAVGFITFWAVQATHWYLVTEFSKFKRFDPVWSTLYALIFTMAGLGIGLVFRWAPVRKAWQRLGSWTLLLSVAGLSLVAHDYIMWMQWSEGVQVAARGWPNLGCFLVGFPLLHLPSKGNAQPIAAANAANVTRLS